MYNGTFSGSSVGKESVCNAGDAGLIGLGWEDPLEEGMATHSSILAWRIPWTEEPELPHRVAKSQTRLKQLSTQRLGRMQKGRKLRALWA